jgi:hypothetical protein
MNRAINNDPGVLGKRRHTANLIEPRNDAWIHVSGAFCRTPLGRMTAA